MINRSVLAIALSLACAGAFAQTTAASTTQRDANQQTRIENGLKDGSLTTREAAKLEQQESRVDRLQARSLKDGKLTPTERLRLHAAQNKVSTHIAAQRRDAQTGNPDTPASRRMQADVARNAAQQQRIANGVQGGSLTNREVATLERGQAKVDRKQAMAGADGHVGKAEQRAIQRTENRQSARIHRQKHDAQVRG